MCVCTYGSPLHHTIKHRLYEISCHGFMLIQCDSALPFYSPLSLQHQRNSTHPHTEHYDVQKAHMWGNWKPNLWISFIFCWQNTDTRTHTPMLIGDWMRACVYNFKHVQPIVAAWVVTEWTDEIGLLVHACGNVFHGCNDTVISMVQRVLDK